jgi:pimeloyl-ACP methyl ester carboxylesterase
MRKLLSLCVAVGAFCVPAIAQAAPPSPFGHACSPRNGVVFCPTATDAQRVPSFDGVPLDADVTLPPTGNGPFPTIVMLHGYGGDKTNFQAPSGTGNGGITYHYNDNYFARAGYAVLTLSARGFGRSCGAASSRTAPGCNRGWLHLADQRFESRDVQHLLGLLADEGVTNPTAIGVTGISYGGGQTQSLARLRNRVRLTNGSLVPWRSPAGKPMAISAGWSRWGWSDLTYALVPNGRYLDFRSYRLGQSASPIGVMKRSFVSGLFLLGKVRGFVAPAGADSSADLENWKALSDRGEPYGAPERAVTTELSRFHSAAGLAGGSAPLLLESGWTDDLFPVEQSLRAYNQPRKSPGGRPILQLGDLGHGRGSNKQNADRFLNDQGFAFLDRKITGRKRRGIPRAGSVTAFTQTCPKAANARGPYRAKSWAKLHPGAIRFGLRRGLRVTSGGGNPATGKAFDNAATGDACQTVKRERAKGTAVYQRKLRTSVTMLGLPTVRATLRTAGRGGLVAARLWDVAGGRQRLISRSAYRLRDNQKGRVAFQLFGNGWRFAKGHTVKLELVGSDPNFLRTSNDSFSVRVSKLKIELPLRERPSARRGIVKPRLAR